MTNWIKRKVADRRQSFNRNAGRVLNRAVVEVLEERRLLAAPQFDAIANQTVPIGKTIQVPLTSTDADGNTITYTAADSTGQLSTFVRPRDGTFVDMTVRDYGTLEFQLFDANAPDAVRRIVGLVNSGFYNGLTFHRVIDGFVIQGGDPNGNGTGGPEFRFDDEFNASNLFTQPGTLAMANSGKDTNGSQFFVTEGTQRALDFNHTIFGQLVRGFDVLNSISAVPTDANGAPSTPVVIDSAEVVNNRTDGVLQIRSTGTAANTDSVTVTATDGTGNAVSRTFSVNSVADGVNDPPFLGLVQNQTTAVNTPVSFDLSSTDLEGDAVRYTVDVLDPSIDPALDPTVTEDDAITTALGVATVTAGGRVTYTPPNGYSGPVDLRVRVAQVGASARGSTPDPYDKQRIRVAVGDQPVAVSGVNVDAARNVNINQAVVATIFDQDLASNQTAFAANVDWGDGLVSRGVDGGVFVVATGAPGTYNVVASHTYSDFIGGVPLTITVNGNKGVQATAVARAEVRPLATLDPTSRILFVNATDGPDVGGLTGDAATNTLRVNFNGTIEDYPLDAVGRIEIQAYGGNDNIQLGGGVTDTYIFGDDGDDYLVGGNGNDTISGGSGKNFLLGGAGDDRLQGSNGRDYLDGQDGNDRLYGDLDRDRDTGRGGNDTIYGGAGADKIFAGAGNDYIEGNTSNDAIRADFGNDTIFGDRGRDILDGGPGTNLTLRSDLDDPDELRANSPLLINITIVDELARMPRLF